MSLAQKTHWWRFRGYRNTQTNSLAKAVLKRMTLPESYTRQRLWRTVWPRRPPLCPRANPGLQSRLRGGRPGSHPTSASSWLSDSGRSLTLSRPLFPYR